MQDDREENVIKPSDHKDTKTNHQNMITQHLSGVILGTKYDELTGRLQTRLNDGIIVPRTLLQSSP